MLHDVVVYSCERPGHYMWEELRGTATEAGTKEETVRLSCHSRISIIRDFSLFFFFFFSHLMSICLTAQIQRPVSIRVSGAYDLRRVVAAHTDVMGNDFALIFMRRRIMDQSSKTRTTSFGMIAKGHPSSRPFAKPIKINRIRCH